MNALLNRHNLFKSLVRKLSTSAQPPIAVLGVPTWAGQPKPGTELAPDSLRHHGLMNKLNLIRPGRVFDFGNLELSNEIDSTGSKQMETKNEHLITSLTQKLASSVAKLINDGYTPLVLGGDHGIALGSVNGVCRAAGKENVSVVSWFE